MNKLSPEKRARVVACLVEGNSIRATVRMTGAAKNTVAKLLVELGAACADFANGAIRGVQSKHIQCDEIWSFCYAKKKNVPEEKRGQFGYGDVWTWTAIDADTKLIVSWMIGRRDDETAWYFIQDVAARVSGRPQITTDGLACYSWPIGAHFKGEVDYAVLQKRYGQVNAGAGRYSPPICIGCTSKKVKGNPDPEHISTSFVERQNLTMRMSMRRFTRLTNGFSKKVENLAAALAVHFVHYNFCRPHQTLGGRTPAMAAGLATERMAIADLVALLDRKAAA